MENLTNWCVYMHENRINGKKYIGITSQKPTKRWQNGKHYDGNAHFYAAICKYGWDGFRHDILYTELTQEEAERLEVELIKKYQTQDPAKGYNLADGGAARTGWHHTEEAKLKIGARTKGTQLSEEHRRKIGDAQRGDKNHMFGAPLTEEHKRKMSIALTGRTVADSTRAKISESKTETVGRSVMCLDTQKIYRSVAEAAKETGINRPNIIMCCQGQRQTAGGFRWIYAEAVVSE